jgi:hypothetical protein
MDLLRSSFGGRQPTLYFNDNYVHVKQKKSYLICLNGTFLKLLGTHT